MISVSFSPLANANNPKPDHWISLISRIETQIESEVESMYVEYLTQPGEFPGIQVIHSRV